MKIPKTEERHLTLVELSVSPGDKGYYIARPMNNYMIYEEILSGQPGAWLVKKMFYLHSIKTIQKRTQY